MIYRHPFVNALAFLAICAGILLSPLYLAWLGCGKLVDRYDCALLLWIVIFCAVTAFCFYEMHQVELDLERALAAGAPWWVRAS